MNVNDPARQKEILYVPGIVEAPEWSSETFRLGQERVVPNLHVVHEDGSGKGAAERELILDRRSRETLGSLPRRVGLQATRQY